MPSGTDLQQAPVLLAHVGMTGSDQCSPSRGKSSALWKRRPGKFMSSPPGLSPTVFQFERQVTPWEALVDKYEVFEKLGSGCAGTVHRAVHLDSGREVALKTLRSQDSDLAIKAKNEYELLKQLEPHPKIIQVVDFHDLHGEAAVVLEFFRGLTLHAMVQEEVSPESTGSVLCTALFEAVAHLHAHGILHRDIKPGNVLVSHCRRDLRLIDFNVAASFSEGPPLTPTGTEQYKAPELFLGEPHSTRSDVWASAMCIFYVLSGTLPQGRNAFDPFANVNLEAALKPASFSDRHWHNVSDEFKAMLQHCLAVTREGRPEMAEVLLDDSWVWSDDAIMRGISLMSRAVPGTEALLTVLPYTCQMCRDAMGNS